MTLHDVDASIPDPSEAAFAQMERHRARAVRCMVAALVIAPVNITILVKTVDRDPALAIATLLTLNNLQLIMGIWAQRAGEAAQRAREPDMSRPTGVRRAIVLGGLAAGVAVVIWLFAGLLAVAPLIFGAPHY